MLFLVAVLLVALAVSGYHAWMLRSENVALIGRLERTEMRLLAEQSEHKHTKERLLAHEQPSLTAEEIVERAARRLKLRKSLSEISAEQEYKNNQHERQHLDRVANIEALGVRDLAMREAEKERK